MVFMVHPLSDNEHPLLICFFASDLGLGSTGFAGDLGLGSTMSSWRQVRVVLPYIVYDCSCTVIDQQNARCCTVVSHQCCPTDMAGEGCSYTVVDQHKSMLDLAQEVGCSPLASQPPAVNLDDGFIALPEGASFSGDSDGTVRICVNGVTVDSTEEFSRDAVDGDSESGRPHRSGRLSLPREDEIRRRSWCPDSPRGFGGDGGDAVDGASGLQNNMRAMSGKR